MIPSDTPTDPFHAYKPRLFGIAYRMLGSRADAEDVVQDAWLRWQQSDLGQVRSSEAWLVTIVTRLALDRLRAAKTEREAYSGPWLPEPVESGLLSSPEQRVEFADDVSLAFLAVLERLAPEERAAFLLREVFDYDYADIAAMLGKNEAACRQMIHRAKTRVREGRPRFTVSRDAHVRMLERFKVAAETADRNALMALFAEDATATADGGGKVLALRKVLHGAERLTRLWVQLARYYGSHYVRRIGEVNGEPALLNYFDGALYSVTTIDTDGERILAVYTVANPDKLAALAVPKKI